MCTLRLCIRSWRRGRRGGDRLRERRVGGWQVRRRRGAISTVASATTPGLIRVKADSRVRSAGWWGGGSNSSLQCCNWSRFPAWQRFSFTGTDVRHDVGYCCCCLLLAKMAPKRTPQRWVSMTTKSNKSTHFLDSHSSRRRDVVMTLISFQSSFVREKKMAAAALDTYNVHTPHSFGVSSRNVGPSLLKVVLK